MSSRTTIRTGSAMRRDGQQRLRIIPMSWKDACTFVASHHRHHKPPRGQKFAIGVVDESGTLRGVATCGRPVARAHKGLVLEVNRTCTDGCPNANSALYGACYKIAMTMGYDRVITYTQEGESGSSLKAAGFSPVAELKPRKGWADSSVKLRDLRDPVGTGGVGRIRWEKVPVV
jgi:hypothetical protein